MVIFHSYVSLPEGSILFAVVVSDTSHGVKTDLGDPWDAALVAGDLLPI